MTYTPEQLEKMLGGLLSSDYPKRLGAQMELSDAAPALARQLLELMQREEWISAGISQIAAERKRQMEFEGWTAEHDDDHHGAELALAAVCYASPVPMFRLYSASRDRRIHKRRADVADVCSCSEKDAEVCRQDPRIAPSYCRVKGDAMPDKEEVRPAEPNEWDMEIPRDNKFRDWPIEAVKHPRPAESGETPHEDALCHRCDRSYNDIVHHNPSIALHHKFVPLPAAPSSVSERAASDHLIIIARKIEALVTAFNECGISAGAFTAGLLDVATDARLRAASRPDPARPKVSIEVYQHDFIPGWAAYHDDGDFNPESKAHVVLNVGGLMACVEAKDAKAEDLPYMVAETIMHEVIHVLEAWAKVEFNEDRVEALLAKYREQYGRAISASADELGEPKGAEMSDEQIKYMVNRFLMWRLPENFSPDGGISFKPYFNEHTDHPMKAEPIGTNLLDAQQATEMVRYLIDGLPSNSPDPARLVEALRAIRPVMNRADVCEIIDTALASWDSQEKTK